MTQSIATKLARASFWPYKGQDKQGIFKLIRVTPDQGTNTDYIFNGELVRPPIAGSTTHYYLIPTTSFDRWSGIRANSQRSKHIGMWLSMKDHWDAFNINFDVYSYQGTSVPLSMLYYKVANNGVMHLAMTGDFDKSSLTPAVDDMYIRMYDNIYYSSGFGNVDNFRYYGKQITTMTEVASLVDQQLTLDLNKCLCFKNGKLIDKHDVAKSAIGDHLEIYLDESIDFKSVVKISDMPYYRSSTHQCNKFVMTIHNDGLVNNQERYFSDDVMFYLYNEVEQIGVYLHTNERKNIMNLTHNVFAIASDYLNDVSEKNGELFNLSQCSIVAVCKKDNTSIKAFSTTLCLHDLYYTAINNNGLNPQSIAQLICSPSTLSEWRGDNLEKGILRQFIDSTYGMSDTLSPQVVGYHSLFDIYGSNFTSVNDGYKIPELFNQDYLLQTFDSNGLATEDGNNKSNRTRPYSLDYTGQSGVVLNTAYFNSQEMPAYVRYYPSLKTHTSTVVVTCDYNSPGLELIDHPNFDSDFGLYDSHLSSSTVTMPLYKEYRVYYKSTSDAYYQQAIEGTHYSRLGANLTWLTNSSTINTCIRSSEDGYCLYGDINLLSATDGNKYNKKMVLKYTPDVLNGHLSVGSINLGNGYIRRHEDVTWGYIHVYLNSRRLIENVDYVIDRAAGTIVLHSGVALLNNTADQTFNYAIYCFGHPNDDMSRVKALEFGVVYNSLISNNSKYESYKNRNCCLVVNGCTVQMDSNTYQLAKEKLTGLTPALSTNSNFYLIEDNYYDVGHMYQSHSGFQTKVQMDAEAEFRVKTQNAINAVKDSDEVLGADIMLNRTVLVSAFLNAIIMSVIFDQYPIGNVSSIDVNHHRKNLTTLYGDLYTIDPIYRWDSDFKLFKQHIDIYPTYCNYVLSVSLDKYKFIDQMVKCFAPQVDINRFINITN